MNEKPRVMEKQLTDDNVILSSQRKMQRITGKRGKHLGAIKINGNEKYQIYLPERPLEVLEKPVMNYIKDVTGLNKDEDLAFVLRNYGKLHEEMHFDNYLEKEMTKAAGREFKISDYQEELEAEYKTLDHSKNTKGLESIYVVATIVNACEYLNGDERAKDLAKMFPEIKEESKFLKSYIKNYRRGMWN
jgi:hypothetical protein